MSLFLIKLPVYSSEHHHIDCCKISYREMYDVYAVFPVPSCSINSGLYHIISRRRLFDGCEWRMFNMLSAGASQATLLNTLAG